MRPQFRCDVRCSREEQQGVVFYRVDDPRSEANFRLYEIEYLIAQKLDGNRTFDDVIESVRREHNFDVDKSDLQRFVDQLGSMGFLDVEDEIEQPIATSAQAMNGVDPGLELIELVESNPGEPSVEDDGEHRRLLKTALLYVRKGLLLQARDYFIAARDLDLDNDGLETILSHLEIIGDTPSTAEMDYLWEQASSLEPELAAEIVAMTARHDSGIYPPDTFDESVGVRRGSSRTVVLVSVAVLAVIAIAWAWQEFEVFAPPRRVRVVKLEAARLPDYFADPARSLRPFREMNLRFREPGTVASVRVREGDRVERDATLAMLELPPAMKRKLNAARKRIDRAAKTHDKAAERLDGIEAQVESAKLERDRAIDKLKELRPKRLPGRGGASRRDMVKLKRVLAQANRKLAALEKKKRRPQRLERQASRKLNAAKRKFAEKQKRVGGKILKSPFSGRVIELKLRAGKTVGSTPVATVRDERSVILTFSPKDLSNFQSGGQALVSVGGAKPTHAKVSQKRDRKGQERLEVVLDDPTGAYLRLNPEQFRLVRDHVEPAFEIPSSALVERQTGASVYILLQEDRARKVPVSVLRRDAAKAIVVDASGSLRTGDRLVTAEVATGEVNNIDDGVVLEVAP